MIKRLISVPLDILTIYKIHYHKLMYPSLSSFFAYCCELKSTFPVHTFFIIIILFKMAYTAKVNYWKKFAGKFCTQVIRFVSIGYKIFWCVAHSLLNGTMKCNNTVYVVTSHCEGIHK